MRICSVSPSRPRDLPELRSAVAASRAGPRGSRAPCSTNMHGGLIQFNGLYARSSAWIETEPSALIMISRVAIGR